MKTLLHKLRAHLAQIPLLSWLVGALAAIAVEYMVGDVLARTVGLAGMPAIFGLSTILAEPMLIPNIALYLLAVYLLPAYVVARLISSPVHRLLHRLPSWLSLGLHLLLFYAALHMWSALDDYRLLVARFICIAIMLTTSLNLVNGYMGEFSCAHGGFMAVGAYVTSVLTVLGFVHDDVFGPPLLPPALGPFLFPVALIIGGLATALTALLVAIPSFRTRGDYLAIITLAFTFIVKSTIENLEIIGGPRGFMNQPKWANLPWTFAWMVICVVVIYNYVHSTFGKGACAIRDDETAAEVMTVNTRRIKVVTFLTSAFWAGVAGGLFAHIMGYINPGTFGILKSTECLAMLYLGGLSSITGSIFGAVIYQLLSEVLRPLGMVKWIVIPLLLLAVMLFRPRGLLGFREIRFTFLPPRKEVKYAPASD